MQAEVAAVDHQRQQIKSDTKAETAQLLAERQQALDALEAEHKQRLQPILTSISEAKAEFKQLSLTNGQLQDTNDALVGENAALAQAIEAKKVELGRETEALAAAKRAQAVSSKVLEDNRMAAADLRLELNELNTNVSEAHQTYSELQRRTWEAEEAFGDRKTEQERLLESNELTLTKQRLELQEFTKQEQAIREDLAARIRAADERDKNLKVREYKVRRDEQLVARNADLLDL